jgi:hypothetical protein
MKKTNLLLAALISALLAGCGGGSDSNPVLGPTGIMNNLKSTNLDESGSPWVRLAVGKLKLWDVNQNGLIPVKTKNISIAIQALDQIEQELGVVIFDRTSVSNVTDNLVSRGIIVSSDTAIGPGGVVDSNACGHVSAGIGTTSFPASFYNSNGNINTVLYVHLSSAGCTATTNIAIHEFGHALGMGPHFAGFGIGDAIDSNFWNVLYNMYNNNVGEIESNLVITQVKF